MDLWCAGAKRVLSRYYSGRHLVVDCDQFRGIARQCLGCSDDERDALADMAHATLRQLRTLGAVALWPAHILSHDLGIERAEPIRRAIVAG